MTDSELIATNPKLAQLNPTFRAKVMGVLRDLAGKGWHPFVASAWRSPEEQLEKYLRGYSKVSWSFHNASTPDGKPDALGCDVVDRRWAWGIPKIKLWLYRKHIMSSAKAHGLTSGGGWKSYGLWGDWAHLETTDVTLREARAGKRP